MVTSQFYPLPEGNILKLQDLTQNLSRILDFYSERFSIERSSDWYLLKIQEELGELTAAYLKLSGRARAQDVDKQQLRKNFEDEVADVIAMTLLFAKNEGVDVEKALQQKWYKHLEAMETTVGNLKK